MRVLKRNSEVLECALTPAEYEMRARALAESIEAYHAENDLQEVTKKDMKAKLADLVRQRDELARVVSRRSEQRVVDVEIHAYDAKGVVSCVRLDTGEVYAERPMTAAERQMSFDVIEGGTRSESPKKDTPQQPRH